MLIWTKIPGASGYVLEKSIDKSFKNAQEVYKGDKNSFTVFPSLSSFGLLGFGKYYRVIAKGGLLNTDSPWSNVVEIKPPKRTSLWKWRDYVFTWFFDF